MSKEEIRPKIHDLKVDPDQFFALREGYKRSEFRKNDRDFESDDIVLLREYYRDEKRYTGQWMLFMISWITTGTEYGIPEGYMILNLSDSLGFHLID